MSDTFTIKDLKEAVKDLPDDMQVILQGDSEGNSYRVCAGVDPNAIYVPDSSWDGDVYDTEWTADECCLEEDEWEEMKAGPKCLVIFPVN